MSILTKAEELINGLRAEDYGDAKENHLRIAKLWEAYTGRGYTPEDVAVMMILLKIARFMENGYHEDTVTDIAGYAGVLEKMQPQHLQGSEVVWKDSLTEFPLSDSDEPTIWDKKSWNAGNEVPGWYGEGDDGDTDWDDQGPFTDTPPTTAKRDL